MAFLAMEGEVVDTVVREMDDLDKEIENVKYRKRKDGRNKSNNKRDINS